MTRSKKAPESEERSPHRGEKAERGIITSALARVNAGDPDAAAELLPLVYRLLHDIARKRMGPQAPDHTLQPTALIHEAYLRLFQGLRIDWQDRNHFLAMASTAMRTILVDHARRKKREKRGGEAQREDLDSVVAFYEERTEDLVALDEALSQLAEIDARAVRIVELHFFAGRTLKETAEVLGLSERQVQRDWTSARAWLRHQLQGDDPN